jgi:hypothetical protein
MRTSEKRLAMVLGGVIGAFGAYTGVQRYIFAPRDELRQLIVDEQRKRGELDVSLAPALAIKKTWQKRTALTMPNSEETTSLAFRSDINALLSRYGLTDQLTLTPKPAKPGPKGPREGFTEIAVGVNTEGKLRNLVEFLRDFYQRPYLKRVDTLTINAPTAEVKTRTGASPDPTLTLQMTLSTLLLPEIKGVAPTPLDPDKVGLPETLEASKLPRYVAEDPRAYEPIIATNVFRLWEPPKPPPVRETPVVVKRDDPPNTTPKVETPVVAPDPRTDADQFTLKGAASLHGELVAYIQDERELDAPREAHLNEAVDDGQLIMIDHRGIVVRTRQSAGRRKDYAYWFYEPGKTFDERDRVTPLKYPRLHGEIQEILRLSGALDEPIEEQPGDDESVEAASPAPALGEAEDQRVATREAIPVPTAQVPEADEESSPRMPAGRRDPSMPLVSQPGLADPDAAESTKTEQEAGALEPPGSPVSRPPNPAIERPVSRPTTTHVNPARISPGRPGTKRPTATDEAKPASQPATDKPETLPD